MYDDDEAATPRSNELEAMESKLNARLALLEKLKAVDVHTACWEGNLDLVVAHLDFAAQAGGLRARRELRAAGRRLAALEDEAATMATKRASSGGGEDGSADECEIAVAYDEKVGDARDAVDAAKRRCAEAVASGGREAANAVDGSEFGEGYRPLHYAAYMGHVAVVEILLDTGARLDAKNDAGCTALFLAAQQGRAGVVEAIYARDPATSCCSKRELVPTGDGRSLCALDAARAADARIPRRAATRALLAKSLGSDFSTRVPRPPTLVPGDAGDAGALAGGVEVRWDEDAYAQPPGAAVDAPPVHSLKIRLVPADDQDGEPHALFVVRAAAHRARVPARADSSAKGVLRPGTSYVARISAVSAGGASAYSKPSEPARAAAPAVLERPSPRGASGEPARRVHPKIARARAAILAGREKRAKLADLVQGRSSRAPPSTTPTPSKKPLADFPANRMTASKHRDDTTDESDTDRRS